eukprot:2402603-Rhodomonas_salina.2
MSARHTHRNVRDWTHPNRNYVSYACKIGTEIDSVRCVPESPPDRQMLASHGPSGGRVTESDAFNSRSGIESERGCDKFIGKASVRLPKRLLLFSKEDQGSPRSRPRQDLHPPFISKKTT